MIEALVLSLCLLFVGPNLVKSFYRGIGVLIADHILYESLICTEEIRNPYTCQKRATDTLKKTLNFKDSEVQLAIQMQDRNYHGNMTLKFDDKHIHKKTLNLNMDKL